MQNHGYNIHVPLEASKKGISDIRTPDFEITGLGRVDVYAPSTPGVTKIARTVEGKVFGGQANSIIVVVPESFSDLDMYRTAAAAFGKTKNGQPIPLHQLIFSKGDQILPLNRKSVDIFINTKR